VTRWLRFFALGIGSLALGCYDVELDPNVSGVYACDSTLDCAIGQQCTDFVCVSTSLLVGPTLEVTSPAPLTSYFAGIDEEVQLVIQGSNLVLTDAPESPDPLAGYIDVLVDGLSTGTVFYGNLEQGVAIPAISLPETPGLHHIRLVALRPDGSPFETTRSSANLPFWVDNGEEHIGIIDPPPGSKLRRNDDGTLRIEVASLNFTFVNPGHASAPGTTADPEGYVHLFIDAAVPECLPDCNVEQYSAIFPPGLSRVNRLVSDQPISLPNHPGTVKLQIVAQDVVRQLYLRAGRVDDFVFHSVPIQPTTMFE